MQPKERMNKNPHTKQPISLFISFTKKKGKLLSLFIIQKPQKKMRIILINFLQSEKGDAGRKRKKRVREKKKESFH